MMEWMTTEGKGTQEVLVGITIHLDIQLEKHLYFQNQGVAQIGLLSGIKEEGSCRIL